MSAEAMSGPSSSRFRHPLVADTALVPQIDTNVSCCSTSSSSECAQPSLQHNGSSQTTQKPPFDGLSFIRNLYTKRNLSEDAIAVLCSSWRTSTQLQYKVYFTKWLYFCNQQKLDPLCYNAVNCVHFLTSLFSAGKSYSAINTARSALSTFLTNEAGLTIGSAPLVKRFMKGVFELRPPLPRYRFVWDISVVLSFLCNYFPNECFPLDILSYKCVVLLALATMQRVQTLHAINVNDICFSNDLVTIPIFTLLKHSRSNNYKCVLNLKYFTQSPAICPALTLQHYVDRTKSIRGHISQLYISFRKPYTPVSQSTIRRWITTTLGEAGIDTTVFKSHSTRAASSARDNLMPVDEILKSGGWTNASVFRQYNDKIVLPC